MDGADKAPKLKKTLYTTDLSPNAPYAFGYFETHPTLLTFDRLLSPSYILIKT
jgi:hypothetical protein